jgi:enamine deaminase RidA (YjgF/YER057c/UK114 family)
VGRQYVTTGTPWETIAGYARAVKEGPFIHVAGTTAADAQGTIMHPGDAYAQTNYVLQKIQAALHELGAEMAAVVRTRMYVTNIDDWQAVARAHGEWFAATRPATALVAVARLIDPQMLVEIEADAIVASST